ncbi:hypothetical protein BDZ89DRAFT_1116410 [Hymenopellis radicata]|nr:hypothetical protein BDZ89DRAFT_1116410 [Hymenopellis radicata]
MILGELKVYLSVVNAPRPPRYWTHERPAIPITYTFKNWNAETNTMMLTPPPDLDSSTPVAPSYRITISLNMNPFLPISYKTSIYRPLGGSSTDETLLGQFEIAINYSRSVLTMGDISTRISNVLTQINFSSRHWLWNLHSVTLRWDCRTTLEDGTTMCICYSTDASKSQLATFIPPPIQASPPLPDPVLTVFPDGHEFFDHLLISCLIIERMLTM